MLLTLLVPILFSAALQILLRNMIQQKLSAEHLFQAIVHGRHNSLGLTNGQLIILLIRRHPIEPISTNFLIGSIQFKKIGLIQPSFTNLILL